MTSKQYGAADIFSHERFSPNTFQEGDKQMSNDWYCHSCKCVVPPNCVTNDERHDERDGGCGNPVGEKADQIDYKSIAGLAVKALGEIARADDSNLIEHPQSMAHIASEALKEINRRLTDARQAT